MPDLEELNSNSDLKTLPSPPMSVVLPPEKFSIINYIIRFCLENQLIVALITLFIIVWGLIVAPFDWNLGGLLRNPVSTDAIPDIGENQQIVFTEWMGRSPQNVEDQITYPLTVALLGIPGIKSVRSISDFGFSSIYLIFSDEVDFYWSRSRILEKLNSLPTGILPAGIQPSLGPDATPLGQVFWYTIEGRDEAVAPQAFQGKPTGGWDLDEIRSVQDWYVRYALASAEGVAEVASVGGYVKEYQIDVDPDALRAYQVSIEDLIMAVKQSNIDVGARTIEINRVEYVIRGLGFIKNISDIEKAVVKVVEEKGNPITIKDVAEVSLGPAWRRGVLDKGGAEAVGGVVVVRHGANPLQVIKNVKEKIEEISPGLPKKTLPNGTVSQLKIIPFYDRTELIYETLGTLNTALIEEVLVTVLVVLFMVMNLGSSLLISTVLPLAILMCFIAMKLFHVDANIVALSGIAIAIGTLVDMGIIVCENILRHLSQAAPQDKSLEVIYKASSEVGSAVLTAIMTTVVSFLPVFTMQAAEGKLFKPLAYTKTFALVSSVIIALTLLPAAAYYVLAPPREKRLSKAKKYTKIAFLIFLFALSLAIGFYFSFWLAFALLIFGLYRLFYNSVPKLVKKSSPYLINFIAIIIVLLILSLHWLPLGPQAGETKNILFVAILFGSIILFIHIFRTLYEPILIWCLAHKKTFFCFPILLVLFGGTVWLGFDKVFGFIPKTLSTFGLKDTIRSSKFYKTGLHQFPGLGKEFMPPLDEGSFLFMPTTMPHASISEALDILQKQDMAISDIPEIESVVGKIGRTESALDPAPISMVETVIDYKSEFIEDQNGRLKRFKYDPVKKDFVKDAEDNLIPDANGRPYRQWREEIKSPDDIWKEIVKAASIPGTTSAPKLQPIAARLVMLQSGMRAPMGIKIKGPDLATIEKVGLQMEKLLKEVPSVESTTVIADRIVGKPYLEIELDRDAIARYGLHIQEVLNVIEMSVGGEPITTTVEGRQRYPVRVRYMRELRDDLEALAQILIPTPGGKQIPLIQLASIQYQRGPEMIKSDDTFLVGYVLFDKKPAFAEVDVVQSCQNYLKAKQQVGELEIPPGVSYKFAGSYENQVRSEKKLKLVIPLALFIIFLILYFQFRSTIVTSLVFSGIFTGWAGGLVLIWLYSKTWFLDFSMFSTNMRELFAVHPFNLSVAVWVGFLALFGIASDDGVIQATYQRQMFDERKPKSVKEIREAAVLAGKRRLRACLMTATTTILALLPVLSSTGRGSDIMVPMAIPSFGGMLVVVLSLFNVPTLYCAYEEWKLKKIK